MQAITEKIFDLISKDKLKEAIKDLRELLKNHPALDHVIVESARYTDLTRQIRLGTLDFEEASKNKSKIRYALIDIIREIEEELDNNPSLAKQVNSKKESNRPTTIIKQRHSGTGDNVGGDKIINY